MAFPLSGKMGKRAMTKTMTFDYDYDYDYDNQKHRNSAKREKLRNLRAAQSEI